MEPIVFKILDNYINELEMHLPAWIRSNQEEKRKTLDEIRTHIIDQAEDYAQSNPITEEILHTAIEEFGKPEIIAADYRNIESFAPSNHFSQVCSNNSVNRSTVHPSELFLRIKEDINDLIQLKKSKEICKLMEWIINGGCNLSLNERYEIIAQVFLANPTYFMKKLYHRLQKYLKSSYYIKTSDLDHHIITQYSLFDNESIQLMFIGKLVHDFHVFKGRFYITNQRMIIQGTVEPTISAIMFYRFPPLAKKIAIDQMMNIQRAMIQHFSGRPCFGFQYPIKKGFNLKTSRKNMSFNIHYDTLKEGIISRKKGRIKITISDNGLQDVQEINRNLVQQLLS